MSRAQKSRLIAVVNYLAAGFTLLLVTGVDFLLWLFLPVFFTFAVVEAGLLLAAGACAAGVWAARMAPTLNREAKISLFTLVLLLRGAHFRLAIPSCGRTRKSTIACVPEFLAPKYGGRAVRILMNETLPIFGARNSPGGRFSERLG
jgi:hypothetical protein